MIQPGELRKGNYILYNTLGSVPLTEYRFERPKELCLVTGFEEDKIIVSFLDETIQKEFSPELHTDVINLSPIRLTTDIVDNCHFADSTFTLTPNTEGFQYKHTTLHYLHQLQNTYFAVTGKELDVRF